MTSELKLKRFLYLCSENSRYIATNSKYKCCLLINVASIFELITANNETSILDLIESANSDPFCIKRENLLFALAVYTKNAKTDKIRSTAYDTVLKVCKNLDEMFLFIYFSHKLNKNFSHGFRRILRDYYLKAEALDLLKIVTSGSVHGWTHKDVIKMIHLKPTTPASLVLLTFAVKGYKEAQKKYEEIVKENSEAATALCEIMERLEKIEALKHCEDEKQALELIKEQENPLIYISSKLLKSQAIWDAIIPKMDIPTLLPELNRLNRLGFLKPNSQCLHKVVEILTSNEKCQTSKIQPSQVFVYLKFFEKGRPMDPQKRLYILSLEGSSAEQAEQKTKEIINHSNPPKNNALVGALYKLLQHSFKNLYITGRRVMVTLDVKEINMSHYCFANKTMTCMDAAALIAYSFAKTEKDTTIAIFNGTSVKLVPLDKGMTFNQYLQKLKDQEGSFVLLNSTIAWALESKKLIDVFINIIYSPDSIQRIPKMQKPTETPIAALKRYRQVTHLKKTKMINVSFGSRKLEIADGSPHILDVCGFDHNVPKIIEACCKGVLQ